MKFKEIYKQIILESTPIFNHNGVKVFPTNHSLLREIQRMSDDSKNILEYITEKASQKLSLRKQEGVYLVYSNKYERGIILDHRKDKYGKDNKMHLFIITILPKGKKQPKDGTKMVMVESYITENNLQFEKDNILIID